MQVRQILTVKGQALFTIAPNQTLADAVATMCEHDVGSLVVFEAGRMLGMLTFREVLATVRRGGAKWAEIAISDLMVRKPVVADPAMEVDDLRRLMIDGHMRYLPVMEGDTLMGVISFHDVAKAVLDEQNFENRMLKAYIQDQPVKAGSS